MAKRSLHQLSELVHRKMIEFTAPATINGLCQSRNSSLCLYTLYVNSIFKNIF